ncbi:hypothetical protein EWB00_002959 [Schistosoma japonicum]|uniref:Uncharacterized protein n=1 Tax=Schistosoma japonicum TaxID=6182 RepID=A0A4Z2DA95_SCHJA|nr:hypothetical protein EWB00_002959 [Schistosoma japonicum]
MVVRLVFLNRKIAQLVFALYRTFTVEAGGGGKERQYAISDLMQLYSYQSFKFQSCFGVYTSFLTQIMRFS